MLDVGPGSTGPGPGSGPSSPGSFATYDPDTSSWRTSQRCFGGGWAAFSGTWPRSGMMRNGRASLLPVLAPRISATAYSYWPTPCASIPNEGERVATWIARRSRTKARVRNGNGFGMPLSIAVQLWPTPSARDWRSGRASAATHARNSRPLNEVIALEGGSGLLNPTWVEWLMGFPCGWSDCEPSATP
jgi:hypothetical protein